MNYQENKKLIQDNIIPHLVGNLIISDQAIYLCQYDAIKLLYSLKKVLPSDRYFLYEDLRQDYIKQRKQYYESLNNEFNFSLSPYARRHGLVKQLKSL